MQGRAVYGVSLAVMGSAVSFFLFHYTSHMGIPVNCLFMFIAGACNCGPDPYISGSIAASIGERHHLSGLRKKQNKFCKSKNTLKFR